MDKYKYIKYKNKYLKLKYYGGTIINIFKLIRDSDLESIMAINNIEYINEQINQTNNSGYTPLMYLIKIGTNPITSAFINDTYKQMFEFLLTFNININILNKEEETLYFVACKYNNTEACELLINKYPKININHKNNNNQRCIINRNNKPLEIASHPIIQQTAGDCFAHTIARCFIRTLQLLGVIKSKHNLYFYKLFYSIIILKFGCYEGGNALDASLYLLNYLKNTNNIFSINIDEVKCNTDYIKCDIIRLSDLEQKEFINILNEIIDALFIGYEYYIVNITSSNYPTIAIKNMLDEKLQPIICFTYSKRLIDFPNNPSNLYPIISDTNIYKCDYEQNELNNHCVNLRRWFKDGIEFKNTWGRQKYNDGNFSIKDIKQLVCVTDSNNYTDIDIICLMFNKDKLPDKIKIYNNNIKQLFYDTIDDITINNNYNYNEYGLLNGYNEYNYNRYRYKGEYLNGMRHGYGVMTYLNGGVYEGQWSYNKQNGQGTYTFPDGKIYEGRWILNMRHGYGKIKTNNGSVIDIYWHNDKPISKILPTPQKKSYALLEPIEKSQLTQQDENERLKNLESVKQNLETLFI